MKTRFEISREVFSGGRLLKECFEYYEEYYKEHGFILDKELEEVYKEFDKEIHLNKGDSVELHGSWIVEWKCVDLDKDVIIYVLIEE